VTLNIPYLGHPMAFEETPTAPAFASSAPEAQPSRLDAFVTSQGWYGPRRTVLHMDA
jgi:hypothetical protein